MKEQKNLSTNGTASTESKCGTQDVATKNANLSTGSGGFLQNFDARGSGSLSLIDESVLCTMRLMQKAEKSGEITPAMINAACTCASSVANLLRLKLDVVKESRRS